MAKQSRGLSGVLTKIWRGRDYQLTVTGTRQVSAHYRRLSFTAKELLTDLPVHPTMWVRLWVPEGDMLRQRAFTLVDPDPGAGTCDIEFALHEGTPATLWAQNAQPGDTVDATVLGTKFAWPEPMPESYLIVGDTASLPAINSLLDGLNGTPAKVWLEWQHEDDQELPVRATDHTELTWVKRQNDGEGLLAAVEKFAFAATGHQAWVACDTATTRALVTLFREKYGLDKQAIKSMGYWKPGRAYA